MGTTTTFFFLKSMQIDSTTLYLQNGKCTTTLPLKNRKWPKTVLPVKENQVSTLYTNIGAPHTYNKQMAVCNFWGRYAHVYLRNYRTILRGGGNSQWLKHQ